MKTEHGFEFFIDEKGNKEEVDLTYLWEHFGKIRNIVERLEHSHPQLENDSDYNYLKDLMPHFDEQLRTGFVLLL